jgi:tetratricopeptide (TPR) repeat protein
MRGNDTRLCWHYEQKRALVLYTLGLEFGDNGALGEAISLYRNTVLPLVDRKTRRDDWATTQNNLGNTLRNLGERESGIKRLEQAVKAYNEALK